jgi:hypothetical protein
VSGQASSHSSDSLLGYDVFKIVVLMAMLAWYLSMAPWENQTKETAPSHVIPPAIVRAFEVTTPRSNGGLTGGITEFAGTGPASGVVTVYQQGKVLGQCTVSPEGTWNLKATLDPKGGQVKIDAGHGLIERREMAGLAH